MEQQRTPIENYYLRRVIGLPGDRVACCVSDGRVTVNGRALHESYLYPGDAPSAIRFRVTIPARKLFLLGDHRSVSADSRIQGPVAVHVVGRVFLIVRAGRVTLVRTPRTFVADGIAPPDSRVPRAIIAAGVNALAALGFVILVIVGVVRYAIRRGQRGRAEPAGVPVPLTAGPPSDGGNDGS